MCQQQSVGRAGGCVAVLVAGQSLYLLPHASHAAVEELLYVLLPAAFGLTDASTQTSSCLLVGLQVQDLNADSCVLVVSSGRHTESGCCDSSALYSDSTPANTQNQRFIYSAAHRTKLCVQLFKPIQLFTIQLLKNSSFSATS